MSEADLILRRIASGQLELVVRKQALSADVTEKQLQRRVASGVLRTIHAGVYFFGEGELSQSQEALAACLACGEGAFVSGRTAGALRGITSAPPCPEVVVPAGTCPTTPGLSIRRSKFTGPEERTTLEGVPIATPARMLCDLDRCLTDVDLERACDAAFRKHLLTPVEFEDYLRSKRGVGRLRRIVRDRLEYGVHDTEFEAQTERVLLGYGLPRPKRQHRTLANGRRVRFDLFYPDELVAIEPNGRGPHWGKEQWQADHDKRIAARAAGIDMIEFTWEDVHERPLYVATTVGDALGLKPSTWVRKDATKRNKPRRREVD